MDPITTITIGVEIFTAVLGAARRAADQSQGERDAIAAAQRLSVERGVKIADAALGTQTTK